MKRIYLFCDNGMSTSLLATRMQKVADQHNLQVEIKAFSDKEMPMIVEEYNPEVILLGPQVKHIYNKVNERYGNDRPVLVIDPKDYGEVNGERVLKVALKAYKERKQ
ncbi:PTS sugar transporter subunit IIB [Erysipelotrichaceae bacterium OH741_COT-311]|nr:PTS sugar transporter subunit IIB [Erysipelotrichaceae bacterium]MDO5085236.1 PTS sugar transporter subunit IIB [Erysipelotrichaceae bacterium]RRC92402.1 PTS sugar transporter subunit IIB [Erysipelotrichaceae bacterium OH741_COT-311]